MRVARQANLIHSLSQRIKKLTPNKPCVLQSNVQCIMTMGARGAVPRISSEGALFVSHLNF